MNPALPILAVAVSLAAFASQSAAQNPKPVFASKVVTAQTPGHVVEVSADLSGAKKLFLAVDDGGNGFACDWADWVEPRLIVKGKEVKLTDLKWKSASADWGNVAVGKNAQGFAVGDKVSALPSGACGHCPGCETHNNVMCHNGESLMVGFAEYARLPTDVVVKLPSTLSFADGIGMTAEWFSGES